MKTKFILAIGIVLFVAGLVAFDFRPRQPQGTFPPLSPSLVSPGALEQAKSQYGQYSFDDQLIEYLAKNIQAGYIDAGQNIIYDPATQQFTVHPHRMPDKTQTYSLEEFKNKFLPNPTTTPAQQPGLSK